MTHDELTGRPILPRDQLRHGAYYRGRCRNALIARWDAERGVFWHWRQKADRIFLESIKHPVDEKFERLDVFRAVEEWPNPKFEIPIPVEAACTCGSREFVPFQNQRVRLIAEKVNFSW